MNSRRSNIKLVAVVILVITLAFGIFNIATKISQSNKIKLTIKTIPSDSKVTLNGSKFNKGKNYLPPGIYSVKVERQGFQSTEIDINLEDEPVIETFALTPVTIEAKAWAEKNTELYLEYEGESGAKAQQEGEDFIKSNPILSFVPYSSLFFSIDYREDSEENLILIITADTVDGRNFAIEQIENWGIKASDYVIEFKGLNSPFEVSN